MPYIANTPESALPRSDSRNPATTCRGITVNGRPCRRALNLPPPVVASGGTPTTLGKLKWRRSEIPAEAFYCWQHQDQVPKGRKQNPRQMAAVAERSSLDSLVERLEGVELDCQGKTQEKYHGSPNIEHRVPRLAQQNPHRNSLSTPAYTPKKNKGTTFCCFRVVDDEDVGPAKPHPQRVENVERTSSSPLPPMTRPVMIRQPNTLQPVHVQSRPPPMTPERWPAASSPQPSSRQSLSPYQTPMRTPMASPKSDQSTPSRHRPLSHGSPSSIVSRSNQLLGQIPPHLSPETTALLLTELSKPISAADEEGYIYIFWITPSTASSTSATPETPPLEIASHLLPPTDAHDMQRQSYRRISDALRDAEKHDPLMKTSSVHGSSKTTSNPKTIRLKIGRTSNVHRRLHQWSRQCSHNLTLIRYYPNTSSSPSPSPSPTPGSARRRISDTERHTPSSGKVMVPHVHRVERLIHIELADRRVKGQGRCPECGKEHREWFELKATTEELRLVDECVRRWVNWGMRRGSS